MGKDRAKLYKFVCPNCGTILLWTPQPTKIRAMCPKCIVWTAENRPADWTEFDVLPPKDDP